MSHIVRLLAVTGLALLLHPAAAPGGPELRRFETQEIDGVRYFLAEFSPPDSLLPPAGILPMPPADLRPSKLDDVTLLLLGKPDDKPLLGEHTRFRLAWVPRLLPADGRADGVCVARWGPQTATPADVCRFVGRLKAGGPVRVRLRYPVAAKATAAGAGRVDHLVGAPDWHEEAFVLNPAKAARGKGLDALWFRSRAFELECLGVRSADSGLFDAARVVHNRGSNWVMWRDFPGAAEPVRPNLFDFVTGASSVTEALARHRLLAAQRAEPASKRTVPVADLRSVASVDHPWAKMMGDKRPAQEPLAAWAPHDFYYAAFRSPRAARELLDFVELWGGSPLRLFRLQARDRRIRDRYERQLCLPLAALAEEIDPTWVRGVAVTGSDLALAEGADLTVVFHAADCARVVAALDGHLAAARKRHGTALREARHEHGKHKIESATTAGREVSLYRAAVGDFVACSNSLPALRRVLDAGAGTARRLADSPDFRYMRTVFRADEADEDGFAFLSDAFVRRLAGPAHKIATARRLEALTSLELAAHAALAAAAETGRLPADHEEFRRDTGLVLARELAVPEGDPVTWDGRRKVAVSPVYNTVHSLTPLIELPLDRVTPAERDAYESFRQAYDETWGRFIDPVGLRLSLRPERVGLQAYILPVVGRKGYARLEALVGWGPVPADSGLRGPGILHLLLGRGSEQYSSFLLADDPLLRKRAELSVRRELAPADRPLQREQDRLFARLPWEVVLRPAEPAWSDLAEPLSRLAGATPDKGNALVQKVHPLEHRKTPVKRTEFNLESYRQVMAFLRYAAPRVGGPLAAVVDYLPASEPPELWEARVKDVGLLALTEGVLRARVDDVLDSKEAKPSGEPVDAGLQARLTPRHLSEALGLYLEWETMKQSLRNVPVWEALYRAGVVTPRQSEGEKAEAAYRLLGYVPVSPDGAGYDYDAGTDEVVNSRHGNHRRPRLHERPRDGTAADQLLKSLTGVRVGLRFREDGVHTTLTFDRKQPPGPGR